MLKLPHSVKKVEEQGALELQRLLNRIPQIKIKSLKTLDLQKDPGFDVQVRVELNGEQHTLIGEVKSSGQPRYAREAILRLKALAARTLPQAIPVFIAPYLTQSTRDLCSQEGVSYVDLEGNARLAFDSVYVEIVSPHRPSSPRREYRSLFRGRSAQVLRVLLSFPRRSWKLAELAQESGVSIGHVSNVQSSLLDREWASRDVHGLSLTSPRAVLDAWSAAYERPLATELRFYTTLHGSILEGVLQDLFSAKNTAHIAMASFSAAQWISPYGRTAIQYFYADEGMVDTLKGTLRLSSASKGENVVVWIPKSTDVYFGTSEYAHGICCTSALQTYLDLMQSGERGQEAATHLRKATLSWTL